MITVHSGWETDFSGLGICPLQPTECTVEEQAGGLYQLKMTHPMDDAGRWLNLTAWNIIRAPAPVRETPYINMMVHTETTVTRSIYTVRVNTRLRLRTKPSTSTGVIIGRYKNGTEVIKTGQSGDWYQVIVCSGGQMGWMHSGYLTFARNETETVPGEDVPGKVVEPRQTRDQLFRIMSVSRDDEAQMVYVTALHVFYDLTGVTVGSEYSPDKVAASVAAQAIFDKAIKPHGFEIYSNNDEKISGEYTGRSIVSALLEEDGVVQQSKARLVRDNFDVFVLKDDVRDRGVEIRHGKNLQGAELTIDVSDVVTSVIPVGRDKNGDPIRLSGQIYVDAENAAELPVVRAKEIEYDVRTGSDGFDTDDKVRAELERLARADYTENGINLPTVGLNVSFVMLENTRQYAAIENYAALQSVHLYDIVRVISAKAGIDALIRVTGYTYNCITRRYDDVTLGELFELGSSISGYDISAGTLSGNKLIAGSVSGEKVQNATINYAKISVAAIEQLAADALTAVSAHINQLVAGTIEADQLYADLAAIAVAEITTANIEKANIDWARIATLSAQVAEIAKAQITQANINDANIDWAKIDTLNAVIASIAQANIAAADIDFAHIKDLAAGTAIITQGVGGKLFISRLAVTEANMVSLSVGELIIKGGDGGFYALGVDAEGNITTTLKQVGNSDVEDLSINAGEKLIEGSVTAATLNATDIFSDSAIIRQLIAANLEVDTLWNREAWMSKINGLGGSLDLSANESIRMVVDSLSTEKSTVYRQEEQPVGAGNGDLWIQPSTGRTWQYSCGEESALRFALTDDGQLAYAYADGETAYPIVIDENGMLAIDADARLLVDPDDVSGVWLLVSDPADPAQSLNTYSGVYINKDEIHLVSEKTTVAVPGANGEDDVARFDAEGVHAQIIEADEINSPSVVATQVAATYTPANAGELTAIAENLKNVCLTGNVTVDASALTGGTLTLRGVSGGYALTISGGTINSAEMIGCTARIVFSGVTFATSGAAATVEASQNVLITGGALNAGTGVLATERSRVCVSSCGGVCDYAADSRGFAEVTFTGTVPGTDMPYGLAKFSDGGQIYAGARLIAKPSAEPEPEKPTVQTVTLTPTLTRTYNGSWRDGYWLWQGRYGTLGLNRGCMWFDTSAFAGKTVLSASLSLKRLSGAGSGVAVAIKICGTTATGASGTPAVGAQYASVSIAQGARKSVDVTSAVQALANGSIRGLMLYDSSTSNLSSSNNWTACYAKLYGYDSGDRPVLTVTYQ